MRINFGIFLTGLGLLAAAIPALAHHSFSAEYDAKKPIKISGVVTKMEWMNPHARFYVDVKGPDGKVVNWNFELGAIPVLLKQGWRKDSLKRATRSPSKGRSPRTARTPPMPAAWCCPMAGACSRDRPAETHRPINKLPCGRRSLYSSPLPRRPRSCPWPPPRTRARLRLKAKAEVQDAERRRDRPDHCRDCPMASPISPESGTDSAEAGRTRPTCSPGRPRSWPSTGGGWR